MSEKMRAEFEAWFLSVEHKPFGWFDHNGLERTADGDCYTDDYVQGCCIGYQAGRESVVIKLPRPFMSRYTENGNCPATDLYSFDGVKSAIEAAGGTVKR